MYATRNRGKGLERNAPLVDQLKDDFLTVHKERSEMMMLALSDAKERNLSAADKNL
jgi:hypothetical protein